MVVDGTKAVREQIVRLVWDPQPLIRYAYTRESLEEAYKKHTCKVEAWRLGTSWLHLGYTESLPVALKIQHQILRDHFLTYSDFQNR